MIAILAVVTLLGGVLYYQSQKKFDMGQSIQTKVNVWDTYVTKKDGNIMHFDILAPVDVVDTTIIYQYGKEYLKLKGQEGQPLTSKQCRLCHVERLRPAWKDDIAKKGYFIIEMEGCH